MHVARRLPDIVGDMTESSSNPSSPKNTSSSSPRADGKATGTASNGSGVGVPPSYHAIRRAMTVDEGVQLRRRPTGLNQFSSPGAPEGHWEPPRRRSSTFSDYSLNEARRNLQDDILNPGGGVGPDSPKSSNWSSMPLAFALLPAVGGVLFKNGGAVITDIMLLGLAAVFLHWSVTQPWIWYHSAQEVRIREETIAEMVIEDESDMESAPPPSTPSTIRTLDDVPEEGSPVSPTAAANERSKQARRALNELYVHEVMALVSCFGFPVLGAYLLHAIRSQLSRPSEGLVSNYNLTIFILAAEIHPLSHLIKLVQARTLHLQRIVHANPFKAELPTAAQAQMQDMARRLDELEISAAATTTAAAAAAREAVQTGKEEDALKLARQEALIGRNVRNAIQPDLDALNRAVRRYEKKATVLALQTDARLGGIDMRLNDAIALAAVAAKNSASSQWNILAFLAWVADYVVWLAMLPFQAIVRVVTLPFRTISGLFSRNKKSYYERGQRDRRNGNGKVMGPAGGSPGPTRMGSTDRVPVRLSKR